MSDKRRGDMDAIELAQQPVPLSVTTSTQTDQTSPIDTMLAPIPGTPTVVPGDDEVDTSGKVTPNKELSDEEKEKAFQAQDQLELQQRRGFVTGGANFVNGLRGHIDGLKNGIGRIPTPVGLALPIITLLVLFFLIVQVNGKSRFSWLWLVLSNNAYVSASVDNSASSDTTVTIPTYAASTTPLSTFASTTIPLSTFASTTIPLSTFATTVTPLSASAFVSLSQEFS